MSAPPTIECPKCFSAMRRVERSGVVVDRCTGCGGLFFDRGELERLLQAESDYHAAAEPSETTLDDEDPGQKRATRRGFLEELLDFG
ncbi:hypothetical protein BH23CHL1_BH23CHL1_20900 [soil metagenome]